MADAEWSASERAWLFRSRNMLGEMDWVDGPDGEPTREGEGGRSVRGMVLGQGPRVRAVLRALGMMEFKE